MTTAQNLADLFDNDGQVRTTDDGRNMLQAARDLGASVSYPNGRGTSPIVYVFDDGSAIVEEDGGWDFRAKGCAAHCWDGIGCDCAERAAQTARDEAVQEANDLIGQSIEHDEIAHGEWTDALADELAAQSDDWTTNGDVIEFWGSDDDGNDWRVHLGKPSSGEG